MCAMTQPVADMLGGVYVVCHQAAIVRAGVDAEARPLQDRAAQAGEPVG
jgi:hypothetical protein